MQLSGVLKKMQTALIDDCAFYKLSIGDKLVALNKYLGAKITLKFNGDIYCLNCGTKTNKSYSQGYCYKCCLQLACCDICIMMPEKCNHHIGGCKEPQWGLDNCFMQHNIYLANTSGVKVGISKDIPTRWIDQGAESALVILTTDSRLKAGLIEHKLKQFVADKTNWRQMLKNTITDVDLILKRDELLAKITNLIIKLEATVVKQKVQYIKYPVHKYPDTITTLNLDKNSEITGKLIGIKGQYLILSTGVFNVRKFSAYSVNLVIN